MNTKSKITLGLCIGQLISAAGILIGYGINKFHFFGTKHWFEIGLISMAVLWIIEGIAWIKTKMYIQA